MAVHSSVDAGSTREKIKAAAGEVFVKKGYAAARMQEIANLAGANKAMIYYYFSSKEALFEAILREAFQELVIHLADLLELRETDPRRLIKRLVHVHFRFLLDHPQLPGLVARELSFSEGKKVSKGEGHFLRYGLSGARGEAESGFRTVRTQAMPVFNRVMADTGDTNLALLQTLLHLMAWNDDTNLVSRGGLEGLNFVQQQAQKLLWEGGVLTDGGLEALRRLDDELIIRHLSPGGSADLLAVTWFLSGFPAGELFLH